ncbi:MAG: hypothetical protein ACI8ZM_001755 [Crocinitomix sp.]|jgi:hypothetical protein
MYIKILSISILLFGINTMSFSQTFNDTEDDTPIENPRIRFVLIETSDVTISSDIINRIRDIGEFIENYYVTQLTGKGYLLENEDMFARNTDNEVLVYTVESELAADELEGITNLGVDLAQEVYTDLNNSNSVWAIIHFQVGGGFVGGGNVAGGRMRFEYKMADGAIDFSSHMSETDFHDDISFKAIHHELGHALTLLHNGPLRTNILYNTMMGPINSAYESTVGVSTADVQISDYSAAIIANHPIFRNTQFEMDEITGKTLRIEKVMGDHDLFSIDCISGDARVRGRVISNLPFHHVVIKFAYQSSYWDKAFAVEPDIDGFFELIISEEDINIGLLDEYEVMVCYDNGLSRGVSELETTESLALSRNQFVSNYIFETNPSYSQTISQSGLVLSTDFSSGIAYQWFDCNDDFSPVEDANDQDFTTLGTGSYAVTVLTPEGCALTSDCFDITAASVYDHSIPINITILPNPNNGEFSIQYNLNESEDNLLEIYNSFGQKILERTIHLNQTTLYLKEAPKGIYFVRIINGNSISTGKVIIQ